MFFNTSERKGVLILILLIVGIFIIPRQFLRKEHHFFLMQESLTVEEDTLSTFLTPRINHPRHLAAIELNTADSAALEALPGIGPYYANKILRYRERLGGFHSVRQLKEVNMAYFNVDSATHLFTVNPALIIKQTLDTMSFKAVLRHPYLEYEDVKHIFNAKRKYKTISITILEEKSVLPPLKLKKIKPYFK